MTAKGRSDRAGCDSNEADSAERPSRAECAQALRRALIRSGALGCPDGEVAAKRLLDEVQEQRDMWGVGSYAWPLFALLTAPARGDQ